MADQTKADAKLIQYLSEAYGKEKELETSLQAHIGMTTRAPYKKRLQAHLSETKNHSKLLERRIKKISGSGPGAISGVAGQAAGQAKSLLKGPLHLARGTGDEEKMLKNAKTEYWNEHEEIATYTAIETLAETVGDKETAQIARQIRREEERMASFLERQIPALTRAVAQAEIPASERKGSTKSRRNVRKGSTKSRRNVRKRSARGKASSNSGRKASARGGTKRAAGSRRSTGSKRAAGSSKSTTSRRRSTSSKRSTSTKRSTSARGRSKPRSRS